MEYPDYKRCPDFRVSTYTCTCLQFNVYIYYTVLACAEGLHFSALVIHLFVMARCVKRKTDSNTKSR